MACCPRMGRFVRDRMWRSTSVTAFPVLLLGAFPMLLRQDKSGQRVKCYELTPQQKEDANCAFLSTDSSVRFSGPFSLLSLEERCPVAASSSSKKRKGLGHALSICDRRPGERAWGLKRRAGPSQSCPCSFYLHSEWAVEILRLAWFYPLKLL